MTPKAPPATGAETQFPCDGCGAGLEFKPGTDALVCPYCGHSNAIPAPVEAFTPEELDFHAALTGAAARLPTLARTTVACAACGASTSFDAQVVADLCPFCGTPIVAAATEQQVMAPQSLLPFAVPRERAREAFRDWLAGLWFAPNDLKRLARHDERLQGLYIPYWTYDCRTLTRYTGMRGTYYWVDETYTVEVGGKRETRTRRVRKTRWYPASGSVRNRFDDVLVMASDSLPPALADSLEPWDLAHLVPYAPAYLAGFRTEAYRIDLERGFAIARDKMDPGIRASIRADIGGDEQRILQKHTRYDGVTFKHLLLPLWISTYRYRDKPYRFLVNARTGEVQGERPYSLIKIGLAVIAGLGLAAGLLYLFRLFSQ